jgi:phage portal protein BeeE
MGLWKSIRYLAGLSSAIDATETKSFVEPPLWDPDHPLQQLWGSSVLPNREAIENDFQGYVTGACKGNGPVFACMVARQAVLSEVRFKFRSQQDKKLFGSPDLAILETPWTNGTTGELVSRMDADAILGGNSYWTKRNNKLVHLRPDWVEIVIGVPDRPDASPYDLDAEIIGYWYKPKTTGTAPVMDPVFLLADQVAHYSPIPDPIARFRGMSPLTPIAREVEADVLATAHKKAFLDNAAVPNMAIKFDKETAEDSFDAFVEGFNKEHKGSWNAYKTLFLMGGADVTPLTMDFHQLEFNQSVGKGESRIAAALEVPSSWVGFSEGMQGSALNAGNFSAARRRFADGTIRPKWRMMAASLAPLVNVPVGAELWYDESGVAFLREDLKDRAEIFRTQMIAIDFGVRSGWEPDAVAQAADAFDVSLLLGQHTGLVSVQMQPPVDPGNDIEETKGQADIFQVRALAIQTLTAAGFSHESAVAATEANDLTLLKKAPTPPPTAAAPAPGTPGPGAPPKPATQPGGGS